MTFQQLLANPPALIALLCIVGLVVGINLPLLFPMALNKRFTQEAKVWNKALKGGRDVGEQNEAQLEELHRQVEKLKTPPDKPGQS